MAATGPQGPRAHGPLCRHRLSCLTKALLVSEDRNERGSLHIALRKFLKVVDITSQREIERVVREGKVEGTELKLRMTLTAENAPLNHVLETIDLR
jgi:hypothetical protein